MGMLHLAALGLAVAVLQGCASFYASPYSANYEALDRLKRVPLERVAIGPVQPSDTTAPVNQLKLRGAMLRAPKGNFAQYLEDALIQDLSELAVFDASAGVRIDAVIRRNEIDVSGISTGTGAMEVDLTISRGGAAVLSKTYRADISFESSFAGAVAIPRGQIEYANLVRTLLGKVYADSEFVNAIKKK